eukprot:15056507-Alexandrium_andersonii.AAC.1
MLEVAWSSGRRSAWLHDNICASTWVGRGDQGEGLQGDLDPALPSRFLWPAVLGPRCRARTAWPGWPEDHAAQSPSPRSVSAGQRARGGSQHGPWTCLLYTSPSPRD